MIVAKVNPGPHTIMKCAFFFKLIVVLALAPVANAQLTAKILSRFPNMGKGGETVKIRFCPHDPSTALAHVGGHECVINVVKGQVEHFHQAGQVVDWIGDQLLMRVGDAYQLI
jgi:hypothetical protein